MPEIRTRSQLAHQKTVQFGINDIAQFLQETLGQKLVAFIAGTADVKAVGRWAKGERTPRIEAEKRLRVAFQIFHLLQEEESPHTVRAWLVGVNPQLDNESPAEAIREGRLKDAVVAAEAYVSGG
jgi:lysophospholipase L1-like esterase